MVWKSQGKVREFHLESGNPAGTPPQCQPSANVVTFFTSSIAPTFPPSSHAFDSQLASTLALASQRPSSAVPQSPYHCINLQPTLSLTPQSTKVINSIHSELPYESLKDFQWKAQTPQRNTANQAVLIPLFQRTTVKSQSGQQTALTWSKAILVVTSREEIRSCYSEGKPPPYPPPPLTRKRSLNEEYCHNKTFKLSKNDNHTCDPDRNVSSQSQTDQKLHSRTDKVSGNSSITKASANAMSVFTLDPSPKMPSSLDSSPTERGSKSFLLKILDQTEQLLPLEVEINGKKYEGTLFADVKH